MGGNDVSKCCSEFNEVMGCCEYNKYREYDGAVNKIKDKFLVNVVARVGSLVDNPRDVSSRNELSNLYGKTAEALEELLDADDLATRPNHRKMLKETAADARAVRALINNLPQVLGAGESQRFVEALQRSKALVQETCNAIDYDGTGWMSWIFGKIKDFFKDIVLPAIATATYEFIKKRIGYTADAEQK